MRILSLMMGLACAVGTIDAGEEVTVEEVKTTATSLDSMLKQNKEKVAVFAQGKWQEHSKDPINVAAVTPVVARKLEMESTEVTDFLQKNPSKLGELVMARLLSEKTGKPWTEIVQGATVESLLAQIQAEQIPLEKAQRALNNIFADVSFAIMDYENRNEAVGGAAGAEKGKSLGKKRSKKR